MERIWQDLRFAARVLRKNPAFATAAILTLALGIGANTAIFSVVNSVLLRPLPYPDPEKLVMIWESAPQGRMGGARTSVSPVNFLDWSKDNSLFSNIGGWQWGVVTVTGGPMAEKLWAQRIAGGYLRALGVLPAWGRAFLPQEERPGHEHVALLSEGLWRRRFGADPSAVGRTITIDGAGYQIVGVMPENFRGPTDPGHSLDLWMPLAFDAALATNRAEHRLSVIARLASGVVVEDAQSKLDAKARQIATAFPTTNKGWGVRVYRLKDEVVGNSQTALLVLDSFAGVANLDLPAIGAEFASVDAELFRTAELRFLLTPRSFFQQTIDSTRPNRPARSSEFLWLCATLLDPVGGGVIGIGGAPLGLRLLPPRRLTLRLAAGVLTIS